MDERAVQKFMEHRKLVLSTGTTMFAAGKNRTFLQGIRDQLGTNSMLLVLGLATWVGEVLAKQCLSGKSSINGYKEGGKDGRVLLTALETFCSRQ